MVQKMVVPIILFRSISLIQVDHYPDKQMSFSAKCSCVCSAFPRKCISYEIHLHMQLQLKFGSTELAKTAFKDDMFDTPRDFVMLKSAYQA